jgi:hypothetical protein
LLAATPNHAADFGVSFTPITIGEIATDSYTSFGCSLVDYDGDGDPDVFVANMLANCLYRNDGGFQFTKVTTGPVVTDAADSDAGVWADFDNDGDLDLFVTNWEAPAADFFYRNDDASQFTRITEGSWVNDSKKGNGAAWADFNNDGQVDLFVANNIDGPSLWKNDGQGGVSEATGPWSAVSVGPQCCAWADYDNDGDPDLFVSCLLGTGLIDNLFFENQGGGIFLGILTGPHVNDGTRSAPVAWGDYDNDGDFDLFVGRGGGRAGVREPDLLYRNNGDRTFTPILEGPLVSDDAISAGAAWGDYDNDGHLDLFVSAQSGPDFLYHNERDGTFSQVLEGEIVNDPGHGGACSWADFDNNGFLDLYVCNNDIYAGNLAEPNFLYRNEGNSNAWMMVRLVGTSSNRAAIGAKIRVRSSIWGKEVWQLRQISGGDGLSQSDFRAHFGLGDATKVDLLRIE